MASGLSRSQRDWSARFPVNRQASEAVRSPVEPLRFQFDESWVEISSRPSSSSVSSIADEIPDVIVNRPSVLPLQRRRLRQLQVNTSALRHSTTGHSLYESSDHETSDIESEDKARSMQLAEMKGFHDIVADLEAKSEPITPLEKSGSLIGDPLHEDEPPGCPPEQDVFTPQPHAFSQDFLDSRPKNPNSYSLDRSKADSLANRPDLRSFGEVTGARARDRILEYRASHEAAMKQSLDTLLSCAKALPKEPKSPFRPAFERLQEQIGCEHSPQSVEQTSSYKGPRSMTSSGCLTKSMAPSSIANSIVYDQPPRLVKTKRRASQRAISRERAAKKARANSAGVEDFLSPTLMTWAVSAGIVVLVSAISFSAGYAIGVEVGQVEAFSRTSGDAAQGMAAGRDVMKGGLRRLKWSTTAAHLTKVA